MTPGRSLLIATMAAALLIGARPIAGVEQFPHGLLAGAEPQTASRLCTIETRPLSFGVYDPLALTDVAAIGEVIYTCGTGNGNGGGGGGGGGGGRGGGPPPGRGGGPPGPGGAAPTQQSSSNQGIRIEMAQGFSNSFAVREMVGPGATVLDYNIYLDATHRTVWGTGEGTTQYYYDGNPPNRTPVIVPAYGRIPGRQNVEAGQYNDSVPVRILF